MLGPHNWLKTFDDQSSPPRSPVRVRPQRRPFPDGCCSPEPPRRRPGCRSFRRLSTRRRRQRWRRGSHGRGRHLPASGRCPPPNCWTSPRSKPQTSLSPWGVWTPVRSTPVSATRTGISTTLPLPRTQLAPSSWGIAPILQRVAPNRRDSLHHRGHLGGARLDFRVDTLRSSSGRFQAALDFVEHPALNSLAAIAGASDRPVEQRWQFARREIAGWMIARRCAVWAREDLKLGCRR